MSLGGIANLDYTILLCNRMDETRAFYRDVMKFPVETDQKNWVSFRVGAALLTLRPRTAWTVCDDGKSIPGSAAVQLAFRVPPPAVDACHAELVAKRCADPEGADRSAGLAPPHAVLSRPRGQHHRNLR